ncbi:MAG TPA: hypothetical protein VH518_10960 [Tepidisphaeraceae bacterium]|jgi:hypothetical protein
MSRPDPVRDMLRQRGTSPAVVRGGLDYLLRRWRKIVEGVERGGGDAETEMDDYLNDMDARQLLQDALAVAGGQRQAARLAEEIDSLDERFQAATLPVDVCVWGPKNAAKHNWTPQQNWWYFRLPRGWRGG